MVYLTQNGTIGFDPQPLGERCVLAHKVWVWVRLALKKRSGARLS